MIKREISNKVEVIFCRDSDKCISKACQTTWADFKYNEWNGRYTTIENTTGNILTNEK